jgi:hypothetical protein
LFNHSGPLGPVEGTPYDPTGAGPSIKLDAYEADAPFAVPAATIAGATQPSFALPGRWGHTRRAELRAERGAPWPLSDVPL